MRYLTRCYLNKALHVPLIMSAHQRATKRTSLDWSSFGKRVVSIKQNPLVKATWVKTINKCSHLKVVSPHLLSKSKRKPAKEVYLSNIAADKVTAWNFNKKIPSQVSFTVTFFRFFQHTEVVVVNVKYKFHLESMCSLKIHDNSNEC